MTVRRNQPARNPREGVLQNLKKERNYIHELCDYLSPKKGPAIVRVFSQI